MGLSGVTVMPAIVVMWGFCVASSVAMAGEGDSKAASVVEPVDILKKAAEATKQIKFVRYSFQRQGTGSDAEKSPKLSGTALFGGWRYNTIEKYRVDVKVQRPGAEAMEVTAGSDGDVVYLIDHAKKTVYADMDPAVLGSQARTVRSSRITDFVEPEPFADEIKAEKLELKGSVKVGGEECFEVSAPSGGRRPEIIWFISKRDSLPRRLDFVFPNPEGTASGMRMELTDLFVNPKLDGDPFKLIVPEGYVKTDDFAP